MLRVRRPLLVPALVLAASCSFGLSACGGGSSGGNSAPQQKIVPKASFITRGDAICKDLNTRLDALVAPDNENDGKAIATYLRQGAQLTEDGVNQLDALGRPDADAALIDTIIGEERDTVNKARQIAGVFDAGDVAGGNAQLKALDGTSNKADADSKQFGFTVCGTNS